MFAYSYKHVKDFIKHKYKHNDYPLNKLKLQFLADFEYYLKTEKKVRSSNLNKMIQCFRKPVRIVVAEGYLEKILPIYKVKRTKNSIVFLSSEELKKREKHEFSKPKPR